jgi:type I restriction enzyme R subunit
MWITGIDVPTCSTVYLDKLMKKHTLMQTIAHANRRAPGKEVGVIVDYVGVFSNLQRALAIYASPKAGGAPIRDKEGLVEELRDKLAEAAAFCADQRAKLIGDAGEALIAPDERRRRYLRHADAVVTAYKALPMTTPLRF